MDDVRRQLTRTSEWPFETFGPSASAAMPLVVLSAHGDRTDRTRYYFWFFGFVAKLPFETTVDELPQLLESPMYSGPHPDYESGRQGKQ